MLPTYSNQPSQEESCSALVQRLKMSFESISSATLLSNEDSRPLRSAYRRKKKPSTSELLDWIKLLVAEDIPPEALRTDDPKKSIPPLYGALLKNEQDVHLFEQLVFLHRRQGRQ